MKFYNLLLLQLVIVTGFAQNPTIEKLLDNKMTANNYCNNIQNYVQYVKVFNDHIFRIEETKVQLFDKDINKVWELMLNKLTNVSGDNYFYITHDADFIYVFQHDAAYKAASVVSLMHRFDKAGNRKTISFNELSPMRRVKSMEMVDGKVQLVLKTSDNTSDIYLNGNKSTLVVQLDQELNLVGDIYTLNPSAEGTDFNVDWIYFGVIENQLLFKRYIFKDASDNPCLREKATKEFEETLLLDTDLNVIKSEVIELPAKEVIIPSIWYYNALKYDHKTSSVEFDNKELTAWKYDPYNVAPKTIYFTKNGKKSEELVAAFKALVGDKVKYGYSGIRTFVDAVEDPINDNMNIILRVNDTRYLLALDDNLMLKRVQSYYLVMDEAYLLDKNFTFAGGMKVKDSWGTDAPNHKMNALDYALTIPSAAMYTVINFDDYQVLFTDNRLNNETWVYKFVK